jgi:hypothetical protein
MCFAVLTCCAHRLASRWSSLQLFDQHSIVARCVLAAYAVVTGKLMESLDHVDVALACLEMLGTLITVPSQLVAFCAASVPVLSTHGCVPYAPPGFFSWRKLRVHAWRDAPMCAMCECGVGLGCRPCGLLGQEGR